MLILPDDSKPFHVICDASDLAIDYALMQFDDEGRERVISYQSCQIRPDETNYLVHDKELMRYALIKFRVHLLGERNFFLVYRSCVATHIDEEPAPVSTDGALAFFLFQVQIRRAL